MSLSDTIKLLEPLIQKLHDNYGSPLLISEPCMEGALAWYDTLNNTLNITSDLSKWSVELLYVLPLHEKVHQLSNGLVDNYHKGYHDESFRFIFENISGMKTFHNEKVGWQFVEKVGDKYIAWLKDKQKVIDLIMNLISMCEKQEQPDNEKKENGDGDTKNGDGDTKNGGGDTKNGEHNTKNGGGEKTREQKINEILLEQAKAETGESDIDLAPSKEKETDSEYHGVVSDIKVGNGKKVFKI